MREMKLQELKTKTPAELVSFAEELEVLDLALKGVMGAYRCVRQNKRGSERKGQRCEPNHLKAPSLSSCRAISDRRAYG
jgi:hypothetical protein